MKQAILKPVKHKYYKYYRYIANKIPFVILSKKKLAAIIGTAILDGAKVERKHSHPLILRSLQGSHDVALHQMAKAMEPQFKKGSRR